MLIIYWLGIGAGAILIVTLVLYRQRILISPPYLHSRSIFLRFLAYPLLISRDYYSSITVLQSLVFTVYLAGNGVYLGIPKPSFNVLANRFGTMAAINMVPLFLPHSNMVMYYLSIPLHVHLIAHHWIGRVCIAQVIAHLSMVLKSHLEKGEKLISGGLAAGCLGVLGILSVYRFRQWHWEIFHLLHVFLILGSAASLIWHLTSNNKLILSIIGPGIWLLLMIPRLWNLGIKSENGSIKRFERVKLVDGRPIRELDIIRVDLDLDSPISISPGQYIYLRIRDAGLSEKLHSHPFMISWWESSSRDVEEKAITDPGKAKSITLLIKPASGLTRRLANRKSLSLGRISFDGPYGQDLSLQSYDNVFLVAKGIGIAGILSYAKQFMLWKSYPSQDQRLVTRKVDLYWELDDNSQEVWGAPFLKSLQADNHGNWLLKIWCFFPERLATPPLLTLTPGIADYRYIYPGKETLETVVKERSTEAVGSTIITSCGVSSFTNDVRSWACTTTCRYNVVDFAEVEYRPYISKTTEIPEKASKLQHRQNELWNERSLNISGPIFQ